MADEAHLLALTKGQWFIPILAEMRESGGTRLAPLLHRLGISPPMARRSLAAMIEAGWIMRNPGHGHPLRPEYLLTEMGRALAPHCQHVLEARRALGQPITGAGRWHLPLIAALSHEDQRFGDLASKLSPVTPRALSLALKKGVAIGHVERAVEPSYPPITSYGLANRARDLVAAVRPLAGTLIRPARALRPDSPATAFPRAG